MVEGSVETKSDTKQVVLDISEKLWLEAKSRAAIEDIPLKDYVARAIKNENIKSISQ